jgi:TonB-linked SusC/RagA family outer membrane protein
LKVIIVLLSVTVFNVFGVNAFSNVTNFELGKETGSTVLMQQEKITGTIIDENGKPLPGVNVQIEGTTIGAIADMNGKYSIEKPIDNSVLVFSFIGYITQRIQTSGKTIIDVTILPQLTTLDEVVVTGYSTQRKKDITGSVAVVDMGGLTKVVSRSAQQALQGLASGVNVITSGVPGTGSKILVRGITSFGNTDPLVIVDGIEQNLNNINASDVESIQVLKDAGAASIYGVRGSNGVIVVSTKKGKVGAPVLSYEGYYGMQYPLAGNPFNVLNSTDFQTVYNIGRPGNEMFKNGMPDYMFRGPAGAGVAMEGDPKVDPSLYFYEKVNSKNYIIQKVNKVGEDWFHDLFKKAGSQNHNLTASGGTEKSKYLFSLGYTDQQGTLVNTRLQRYSGRINTEYTLNKWLKVGENANIIFRSAPSFGNNGEFGGIAETYKNFPVQPLYDIMGNWGGTFGGPDLGSSQNPTAVQYRDVDKDIMNDWYIIGNTYAEVTFLKGFTARTSIGYNINNYYNQNFTATQTENVQSSTGNNSLGVSANYSSTETFTNTLNYQKKIGKHDFKVMAGSEAIHYLGRSVAGGSSKFFSEDFNYLVLGNGTLTITNSSGISENSLFSLFGRADYSFDDKYLLGVTVRRDGSSKFGPDKRYGIFPSFSLGWRVSNESFMKDLTWVNDLKIRGSYGILGSQNNVSGDNSFFLFGSGMGTTYYDITGASTSIVLGFAQSRIGNLATGWEENIVSNFGFDASILNNSLDISLEYYKKAINGLLFSQPLPAVVLGGATSPTINIGDIQNTGVDASIAYRGKITNDLRFKVGLNLTTYKNEVVDIPNPGYFYSGSLQGIGSICRNEEGHPVSSFYGYKVLGLFNSDAEVAAAPTQLAAAPGRFRYQDTNGDNAITVDDRVHLGSPNPDFTYGLTAGLDYKGFDFSAIFYGSQGNEIFNTTRCYLHFFQYYNGNKSNVLLDAWTPEHTNTTVPKIESTGTFSTSTVANSYYVEDGSYLRLKSLILGYTIKPTLLKKFGMSNLRVYAQAANLFTFTKYTGLDPEMGGSTSSSGFGIDFGSYPDNELGIMFGLNITF